MDSNPDRGPGTQDLADLLITISVISRHLARRLQQQKNRVWHRQKDSKRR